MSSQALAALLSVWFTPVLHAQAPGQWPWQEDIQAGWQAQQSGRPAEAQTRMEHAWQSLSKAGPRAPDYAASLQNIAQFWQSKGYILRAEAIYKTGSDAAATLDGGQAVRIAIQEGLAQLYLSEQRAVRGIHVLEELADSLRRNNKQADETRNVLFQLAAAYEGSGRPQDAEEIFARFADKTALADFYAQRNRRDEAEKLYKQALAELEAKEGPSSPALSGLLQQMSWFYRQGKEYGEAEEFLERGLAIQRRMNEQAVAQGGGIGSSGPGYFEEQPLVDLYLEAGRNEDANRLLTGRMEAVARESGQQSADYRGALAGFANAMVREKRFDEAEKTLQDYMGLVRDSGAGENGPETQNGLWQLSQVYAERGDTAKAEKVRNAAMRMQRGPADPNDPLGANTAAQEANEAFNAGQLDRAKELVDSALNAAQADGGSRTCTLLSSVAGSVVYALAAHDEGVRAEQIAQRTVRACEEAAGPNDSTTLSALDLLANLYGNGQRWRDSRRVFERKMALTIETRGEDSPSLTNDLERMASLAEQAGVNGEAERLFAESLRISETERGPQHPALIQTLTALGTFYLNTKQADQAKPVFERAIALSDQSQDPIARAWLASQIGQAYAGAGQTRMAAAHFRKALAEARTAGPGAPETIQGIEQNYKAALTAEVMDDDPDE